jgi:holo-[acyl-carrier protein] synthase
LAQNQDLTPSLLAKRFAAKEAIAKAMGTGIGRHLSFHDIKLSHDINGKPLVEIADKDDLLIHLSVADENEYAIAYCIIEKA